MPPLPPGQIGLNHSNINLAAVSEHVRKIFLNLKIVFKYMSVLNTLQ